MLSRLTRTFRFRAALALAALYALCILAPHAALALGNGAGHCLTEIPLAAHVHAAAAAPHTHAGGAHHHHHHHDVGAAHDHAGGVPQDHSGQDRKSSENCCGLFCASAIVLETDIVLTAPPAVSPVLASRQEARAGRGPDRLIRPPIA